MSQIISVLTKIPNLINDLRRILPGLNFHDVKNPECDSNFKQSRIIIGDYPLIGPYLYNLPNAEWIQGTWAGVEKLLEHIKTNEDPKVLVTRFTGKSFGIIMAEYVIANIINNERNTFGMKDNQKKKLWIKDGRISSYRTLTELNIGIMGLGSIGGRIANTLHSLGATVFGYGRRPSIDMSENVYISNYFSRNALANFLKVCDYFVNILPDTDETRGLLNADILESCKERGGTFINIGRGSIISEMDLINALEQKWISAAILDVFPKEPLPSDSKLWTMENVFITPHVAGVSRSSDIAENFKENLYIFNDHKPVPGTIDFSKGY